MQERGLLRAGAELFLVADIELAGVIGADDGAFLHSRTRALIPFAKFCELQR